MTKLLPETHRRHISYTAPVIPLPDSFSDTQSDTAQSDIVRSDTARSDTVRLDDTDQLWSLYRKNPTDQLRNRLVERYISIVQSKAEQIWAKLPEGVELDDLIQVGTCGLMNAIASYDPTRGVRFEAFCLPRIRGAMVDELRANDFAPRGIRSKSTKLNSTYKRLEQQYGRKPTDQEVADDMGISGEELHQIFAETHSINITSLDKTWSENDGSKDMREIDTVPDRRSEDPTERLAKIDLIRSFTKGLNKTERMVIILYYYEELTMREIGAALEISESRVSQMHSSIVDRMKKMYGKMAS